MVCRTELLPGCSETRHDVAKRAIEMTIATAGARDFRNLVLHRCDAFLSARIPCHVTHSGETTGVMRNSFACVWRYSPSRDLRAGPTVENLGLDIERTRGRGRSRFGSKVFCGSL